MDGNNTSRARRGWVFSPPTVKARTFDFNAGDVGYVPFAMATMSRTPETPHCGSLRCSEATDLSLNQWMALTPRQLLQFHSQLDDQALRSLQTRKSPVVPG
jgi:oxalate decarboxylase